MRKIRPDLILEATNVGILCADRQGRILIPQTLRDHARLEREVVLAGMTRSFEIWSKPLWEEEIKRAHEDFSQITATLADLGV